MTGGRRQKRCCLRLNESLTKFFESKKKSKFYRQAKSHPVGQVLKWLEDLSYAGLKPSCQTIFQDPATVKVPQPVNEGHGQGVFVVIAGKKSCAVPPC
jgi:hypothetical protein